MRGKESYKEFLALSFEAGLESGVLLLIGQEDDPHVDRDWWATYCMGGEL